MTATPIELFEKSFFPLAADKVALPSLTGSASAFSALALVRNPPEGGVPFVAKLEPEKWAAQSGETDAAEPATEARGR